MPRSKHERFVNQLRAMNWNGLCDDCNERTVGEDGLISVLRQDNKWGVHMLCKTCVTHREREFDGQPPVKGE